MVIGVIFVLEVEGEEEEEEEEEEEDVLVVDVADDVGVDAGLVGKSDEGALVSRFLSVVVVVVVSWVSPANDFDDDLNNGFANCAAPSAEVEMCDSSFVSIVCGCFCSTTSLDGADEFVFVVVVVTICSLSWSPHSRTS